MHVMVLRGIIKGLGHCVVVFKMKRKRYRKQYSKNTVVVGITNELSNERFLGKRIEREI